MGINRHNYEAYLLDQLEGKLSVEEQQQLQEFLLLNPDCEGGLTSLEPWILEEERITYQNRDLLRKDWPHPSASLSDHNFDLFSVARLEGDLNLEQEEAHQSLIDADEENARKWEQWQRTRLVPQLVRYPEKDRLLRSKGSGRRIIWLSIISAAAAVALVLVLLRSEPELPQQQGYFRDVPGSASERQGSGPDLTTIETPVQEEADEEIPAARETEKSIPGTGETQMETPRGPQSLAETPETESLEADSKEVLISRDDLQPRVIAYATLRQASPVQVIEAVPDRIVPLQVPTIPIHMSSLSIAQLSELGLQEMIEVYAEENDLSIWKIAGAGIKGINKLAGSEIKLLASKDEEGEVDGFRLKSKRFSISRPLGEAE